MPILGTCIKEDCDEPIPMFGETEDGRIAYVPHTCEKCGTKMWTVVSRISPCTYSEEEFLKRFDVNTEQRNVKPKAGFDYYGYPETR